VADARSAVQQLSNYVLKRFMILTENNEVQFLWIPACGHLL